jgi:nucleotide-binding universal stress UspA family protein
MRAIKRIILPTDLSDTSQNAFRYALRLADRTEAAIELIHVIFPEYAGLDLPVISAEGTQSHISAARAAMQAFVEYGLAQVQLMHNLEHIPDIHPDVEVGSPSAVIARLAERDEASLIVMGTKGEHGLLEKTFGSVTTEVLRRSRVPVLVVPEDAAFTQIRQVAYASELKEEDAWHIWGAMKLLEEFEPQWHLVHIQTPESKTPTETLQELTNLMKGELKIHQLGSTSVLEGLEDFAQNFDVDLLVMLSRHESIWRRLFYRSKTRQMAYQTQVPLLVVHEVKS